MDAIAILQQLDQECTTWANQHAHSCNLLASLLNITRQREQTLVQFQQQKQLEQLQQRQLPLAGSNNTHSSARVSIAHVSSKPSLIATTSLQLLIHKQTLENESVIQQLYDTIAVFQRVVQAIILLERQVEAALERIESSKLLATIHHHDHHHHQPLSSTSNSPAKPSYASEPSLIETAEISPLEVLDWVGRIRSMYAQELNLKQSQIHPGMTALERFESLVELQRSWGLQHRIDFGLEQEILERIKAYRRVREFSSRT